RPFLLLPALCALAQARCRDQSRAREEQEGAFLRREERVVGQGWAPAPEQAVPGARARAGAPVVARVQAGGRGVWRVRARWLGRLRGAWCRLAISRREPDWGWGARQ